MIWKFLLLSYLIMYFLVLMTFTEVYLLYEMFISHCVLIKVLEKSGFDEFLLSWLKFFFLSRHQLIKVFSFKSNAFLALSGFPQGNHSFPLLFPLFVNNIWCILRHSHLPYFANDINIYMHVNNLDDY